MMLHQHHHWLLLAQDLIPEPVAVERGLVGALIGQFWSWRAGSTPHMPQALRVWWTLQGQLVGSGGSKLGMDVDQAKP